MSIRAIKQYSDRGSIKNLINSSKERTIDLQPSTAELRLKKLYEFAQDTKDYNLQSSLGIITTDYISDKNALPINIYRIRSIVNDIKANPLNKIDEIRGQLKDLFTDTLSKEAAIYMNRMRIKTASRKHPVFWRASKV